MNKSPEPPTHSEISGPQRLGEILPSAIGSQRGEIGFAVTSRTVELATAKLVSQRPKETDENLLATLSQRYGISMAQNSRWMFPADRPAYKKTMGMDCSLATESQPAAALHDARMALFPAEKSLLVRKIAELKAKTKSRAQGEMDMGMEIAVYEKELAAYPADIAIEGLRLAAEESMWFPSWFEMKEILDQMYAPRKMVIDKLLTLQ